MDTFFSIPERVLTTSHQKESGAGELEIWTYDKQFVFRNSESFFLTTVELLGWRFLLAGSTDAVHHHNLSVTAAPVDDYFAEPNREYGYFMTADNIQDFENTVRLLISKNKQSCYVVFKEQDVLGQAYKTLIHVFENYPQFRMMFSYDHGVLLGLVYGKPIVPPKRAVIEIHDDCNLKCDFCWTHSPLLETPGQGRKKMLDVDMFYKYVDELASIPVEVVELCAVGDPLYHPHVWEMIHYIRQKGIPARISTNGTLINKRNAEDIIRWGVSELAMNISGGDPESYAAIHNVSSKLFENLKKNLCYLNELRKRVSGCELQMNHINVLTEKNARAIPGMIHFAQMTGADSVSFRAVWPHQAFLKRLDMTDETLLLLINEIPMYEEMVLKAGIREHNLSFFDAELRSFAKRRGLDVPSLASTEATPYTVEPPKFDSVPTLLEEPFSVKPDQVDTQWMRRAASLPLVQKVYDKTLGFRADNELRDDRQPLCAVSYHFTLLGSDNKLRFCCRGDKSAEAYKSIKEQWTNLRYQSFRSTWREAYKNKKSLCVGCPHEEENHRYSVLLYQHGLDELARDTHAK